MATIHEQVYEFLRIENQELYDLHPRDIFFNHSKRGLRLTKFGFNLLRKHFDTYEFAIAQDTIITTSQMAAIGKKMEWPFYITKNKIVFFTEEDAAIIKIVGSFEGWVAGL